MTPRLVWTSVLAMSLLVASTAAAEPPHLIPVQGYLTDGDGAPLNETVQVHFRIYDQDVDGATLHDETQEVMVTEGHFTVYLGETTDLDPQIFVANQTWLGIAVGEDEEATPRIRLASVPYALTSLYCGDATTLGGLASGDFARDSHEHVAADITDLPADTNAGTLCDAGQYLDGDGTCQSVSNVTDTNAGTLCADGEYLDGDGTCKAVPVDTNTNAGTLCSAGQYLDGDGTCKAVPVDTNTNAGTLCSAGQYLDGDGTCRAVPVDTNTNAQTLCGNNQFLRGDGLCVAMTVDTNTNAQTICPNDQFLRGDGACVPMTVDTNAITLCGNNLFLDGDGSCVAMTVDTNTNAATLCSSGQYLDGSGACRSNTPVCTQVDSVVTTVAGYFTSATATCPAGSVATGGGHVAWSWSANDQPCAFMDSYRSGNGWYVRHFQPMAFPCDGNTFRARATCCTF